MLLTFFPVAALITSSVAIGLFIVKECRENFKKKNADRLKLVSLCLLFLEKIRINKMTATQLDLFSDSISSGRYNYWVVKYELGMITIGSGLNKIDKYDLLSFAEKDFFEKGIYELAFLDVDLFNDVTKFIIEIDEFNLQLKRLVFVLHANEHQGSDINNIKKSLNRFDDYIKVKFIPMLNSVESKCKKIGGVE